MPSSSSSSSEPSSSLSNWYNSISYSTNGREERSVITSKKCENNNNSSYDSYQLENHSTSDDEDEEEQLLSSLRENQHQHNHPQQETKSKRPSLPTNFSSPSTAFLCLVTFIGGITTGTVFRFNGGNNVMSWKNRQSPMEDEHNFGFVPLESLIHSNENDEDSSLFQFSSVDNPFSIDEVYGSSRFNFLDRLPHEVEHTMEVNDENDVAATASKKSPRYRSTGGPPLLYLRNEVSYNLLYDHTIRSISQYSSDYFLLTAGWDAQINQAYCGPASVAALLNSLRFGGAFGPVGAGGSVSGVSPSSFSNPNPAVALPVDAAYSPYKYATQRDLFGSCTSSHVIYQSDQLNGEDGVLIPPYGLNLAQVTKLLQCHFLSSPYYDASSSSSSTSSSSSGSSTTKAALAGEAVQDDDAFLTDNTGFSVKLTYVDKTRVTLGKMRFDLRTALKEPHSRIIIGYSRKALGQVGGGHISPIGSYHPPTDSFLIMDVSKYKYPPVWVPAQALYEAMAENDDCGKWDYPSAQLKLTKEMKHPFASQTNDDSENTAADAGMNWYQEAMGVLGCASIPRGYVVVKRN